MRALAGSLKNFVVTPLTATAVSVPFGDDFSQGTDSNTQLSLAWQQQLGDFAIQNGVASGNAPTSLATLDGLNDSNLLINAKVTLGGKSSNVGFVAEYSMGANGPSYYWGYLAQDSKGNVTANIAKVINGGQPVLLPGGSKPLAGFNTSTAHVLRFRVAADLLLLSVDSQNVVNIENSPALSGGGVGLLASQGSTYANFTATPGSD
jgi:hypothetical protein